MNNYSKYFSVAL